mmetsp:Transcript_30624/g.35172  ORF Transcript_30624/g.35172 Transcript_30624/m.35172 type:complete len:424 (-) Transcript_30624:89-1360(-)
MGDAKIPPVTVSFFIIFPTVALAFSVAILASPEPRSWAFFATLVITWIGLKGSSWFIYKSRDDVAKLEKVASATEEDIIVGSPSRDEEETTDEPNNSFQLQEETTDEPNNSFQPQIVYNHTHLYKIIQGLMRPPILTIQICHASVLCLLITLSIRIFCVEKFGSHPANLDFGSNNVAFVNMFQSFTTMIQGVFAAFLTYPAVVGLIARVFTTSAGDSLLLKKPNVHVIWFCEVVAACMTIFPTASIIIAIAHNYVTFSNSPHLYKLAEWLIGYTLGITAGVYFSSIVQRVFLLVGGILNALENNGRNSDESIAYVIDKLVLPQTDNDDANPEDEKIVKYGFGKASEHKGYLVRVVEIVAELLTKLCYCVLAIATLLNGIFIGMTWNYDSEGDKASLPIICIFIGVAALVYVSIALATNRGGYI